MIDLDLDLAVDAMHVAKAEPLARCHAFVEALSPSTATATQREGATMELSEIELPPGPCAVPSWFRAHMRRRQKQQSRPVRAPAKPPVPEPVGSPASNRSGLSLRIELDDGDVDALAERIARKLREAPAPAAHWETVAASAKRFGVTERALHDAGRRGEIITSRVGKRTMLRADSVAKWIEKRARQVANDDASVSADASGALAACVAATRARRNE